MHFCDFTYVQQSVCVNIFKYEQKGVNWMWTPCLIILEPGQALRSEHEPVFLGTTFHDANIVDSQPTFAYDLYSSKEVKLMASLQDQLNNGENNTWEFKMIDNRTKE